MQNIKVFLASSGELKSQRVEIEKFIARENDDLTRQDIYLELILWEKESKSIHKERIQNKFNKLLLNSEIVIVLFFAKAGPFTIEEYQLAYDNHRNGKKPFSLIVCFDMNDIPQKINNPEHFQKIQAIKKQLQNDEQLYFEYKSIDKLILQLKKELDTAIEQLKKESTHKSTHKSNTEDLLDKFLLCNRDQQVIDFKKNFEINFKKNNRMPQYYVIHGHEDHSHDTLVTRLIREARKIAEIKKWKHEVYPNELRVEWPTLLPLETRKDKISDLIKTVIMPQCKALEKPNEPKIFFIRHHIHALVWDKVNGQLIQWYLQSCWNNLSENSHFVIFFEIYYEKFFSQLMTAYPCFRIKRIMKKILKASEKPCEILPQLRFIKYVYILSWLQSNLNLDRDKTKKINKDYKFKKYRKYAMAHIKDNLIEIEKQYYENKISGLYT